MKRAANIILALDVDNLKKAKVIFQQVGASEWVKKTDQELNKLPK